MRKLGVIAIGLLLSVAFGGVASAAARPTGIRIGSITTSDSGTTYDIAGKIHSVARCLQNRTVKLTHGDSNAAEPVKTDKTGAFSFNETSAFMTANTGGFTATVARRKVGATVCAGHMSAIVYWLHVASSNASLGAVVGESPSKIDCGGAPPSAGSVCDEAEANGISVKLDANPTPVVGSFQGWEGDCTGTTSPCTVTMTQDRSVQGDFTL